MIQSPLGPIDIIAHSSFDTQTKDDRTHTDRHIETYIYTDTDKTDSSNQLVWSNPIQQSLHPRILRQLPYSNTSNTSHGAVSENSIRSIPFLGCRRDNSDRMETMVLHT